MKHILVIFVFCVLFVSAFGRVEFKEGRFKDGDADFFIKGIGYAPVPIGVDPTAAPPYGDYFTANYANVYNRDLPIIRSLGANVLRLWGWNNGADHSDFLNKAYNGGINPIYVAAEFWIGPSSYSNLADPIVQQKVIADFNQFLVTAKVHPAILFYIIGSDLNAGWNYGGELDALFSVLNTLANIAHGFNSSIIVTTALNDVDSMNTIAKYDIGSSLDIWSLNLYRGCDFGPLFTQYTAGTKRPLFVSEYGIDSYNDQTMKEDDTLQANCIVALTKQLLSARPVALGGAVVEYVDEFWKGKLGIADARHTGARTTTRQCTLFVGTLTMPSQICM